jgi:putative ATP-dependent endonuclease of OLD family
MSCVHGGVVQISKLAIKNFRGIKDAELDFQGHTLLIGGNNVGKSTICEALELALGPDRQSRFPVVEEYDFYNAAYIDEQGKPVDIRLEVLLTDVTPAIRRMCKPYLERWDPSKRELLGQGKIHDVDTEGHLWALRLITIARYSEEDDEFLASTHYAVTYDANNEDDSKVNRTVRRAFGFLYLRAFRTGSRALSLERGSLLDVILRIQSLQTGIWEYVRGRLEALTPAIDDDAKKLTPVLQSIEQRLLDYIQMAKPGESTRIFVSKLTREHLRKTLSFFLTISPDQKPVPFQEVGTGTLNTLILALLSFIAELKEENVIFAIEEPEIALPPHTQRRIADYLLQKTTQCLVTSHSPYVIESFLPEQTLILRRDNEGRVVGRAVSLAADVKAKTYRRHLRKS